MGQSMGLRMCSARRNEGVDNARILFIILGILLGGQITAIITTTFIALLSWLIYLLLYIILLCCLGKTNYLLRIFLACALWSIDPINLFGDLYGAPSNLEHLADN